MSMKAKKILVVVVALLIILVIVGKDKIGNFIEISKNIAINLSKDPHDAYYHDDLDTDYIVNKTGITVSISEKELPEAFQPFKEVTHPPFRQGACQVCHAPTKDKVVALVTRTTEELCYKCHPPAKKPDFNINCNKCHDPHQSDRELLVRNKVVEEECPVGDFVTPVKVHIR